MQSRSWAMITVAAVAAVLALPGAALAAPLDNNNYANAQALDFFERDVAPDRTNAGATLQANEAFSAAEGSTCDGRHVSHTIWYEVPGSGGPVTVHTRGSAVDTVVLAYNTDSASAPPAFANVIGCNDDISGEDRDSEVTFNTQAGISYLVQVGGCAGCPGPAVEEGVVEFVAYDAPGNDNRAAPTTLAAGAPTAGDNFGATLETDEVKTCGNVSFGKTVWYRYQAPKSGRAIVTASGIDTVLTVYRGGTVVGCNDDGPGQSTASRVEVPVAAGDYLIQIGGIGVGSDAEFGAINAQVEFVEDAITPPPPPPPPPPPDLDADNDGINRPADCDDNNPHRRPGLPEIRGNGQDEDCVGGDLGFARLGTSYAVSGVWGASGRFTRLELRNVEAGSTVRIRCRGKGCRRKTIVRRVRKAARRLQFAKAMQRNRPRPGARIEVRVTKPGKIGKLFTYRIRSFKEPVERTLCLPPGASRASRCRR